MTCAFLLSYVIESSNFKIWKLLRLNKIFYRLHFYSKIYMANYIAKEISTQTYKKTLTKK